MAEQICDFSQLAVSGCAHCRPAPAAPRWHPSLSAWGEWNWPELARRAHGETSGMGRWISARYDGRCGNCGGTWEPGDHIRFSDDDGGWVCEPCGSPDVV